MKYFSWKSTYSLTKSKPVTRIRHTTHHTPPHISQEYYVAVSCHHNSHQCRGEVYIIMTRILYVSRSAREITFFTRITTSYEIYISLRAETALNFYAIRTSRLLRVSQNSRRVRQKGAVVRRNAMCRGRTTYTYVLWQM